MNMQRFQSCKKIVTLLLTICMILPLMLNQYLMVHAAEPEGESETVTKTLAELINAASYEEIDMTDGKDFIIENQLFSEEKISYMVSAQSNTSYAKLYRIKVGAHKSIKINTYAIYQGSTTDSYDCEFTSLYWYEEDNYNYTLDNYGTCHSYINSTDTEKYVYVLITKPEDNPNSDYEKFAISCMNEKTLADLRDEMTELPIGKPISYDFSADNYFTDVPTVEGFRVSGWLYKYTGEDDTYEIHVNHDETLQQGIAHDFDVYDANGYHLDYYHCDEYSDYETTISLKNGDLILVSGVDNDKSVFTISKKEASPVLSELISQNNYTEVSLLEKDAVIEKKNLTFSDKKYTYPTSYEGLDNTSEDGKGILFKVTLGGGMTANVQITAGLLYVYDENLSLFTTGNIINNNTQNSKVYYVWLVKGNYFLGNTTTVTFVIGKKITDYTANALEISTDNDILCTEQSSNYLTDVDTLLNTISSGWIFKNSLTGSYELTTDQSIYIYTYNANGNYNGFYNIDNQGSVFFDNASYLFIVNCGSDNPTIKLSKAKNFSELDLPVLNKGQDYIKKDTDKKAFFGNFGYSYGYEIDLTPSETVSVSLTDKNGDSLTSYALYSDEGKYITSPNYTNTENLVYKNTSSDAEKIFIAVAGDIGVDYVVKYDTAPPLLSELESKAIEVNYGDSLTFEQNDSRFVSRTYTTYSGNIIEETGALVKLKVNTGDIVEFKIENSINTPHFYFYDNLQSGVPSEMYQSSYKFTQYGSSAYVYFFILKKYAENATVTIDTAKTISYKDVEELQIGENNVTYDGSYVTYPVSYGTEKWDGKVFHLKVPDDGRYMIKAIYTGDMSTFSPNYEINSYIMDESGYMHIDGRSINPVLGGYNNENATEGYYFLGNEKEYWICLSTNSIYGSEAFIQDAENVKLIVQKISELQDSDITIAEAGKTYNITAESYMIGTYEDIDVTGSIYKLTVPAGQKITITTSVNYNVYTKNGEEWKSADINDCLENDNETAEIYLIKCGKQGFMKPFNITFSEFEAVTPLVSLNEAVLPELTIGKDLDLSTVAKQRIGFSRISYPDTYDNPVITSVKYEGYWIKFTVPEGKRYHLYGTVDTNEEWNVYNYDEHDAYGLYVNFFGSPSQSFVGGTYYLCIPANKGILSLKEIDSLESIKDQAYVVTSDDIEKGYVICKTFADMYTYCCNVYEDNYTYLSNYGVLLKCTLPAGKTYSFSGNSFMYKADDFDTPYTGYITNTSNLDEDYYIWYTGSYASYMETISIQIIDNLITNCLDGAESLNINSKTEFTYDASDIAYKETLTYRDMGMLMTTNHAKIYRLDKGIYALNADFEQKNKTLQVYIFNKKGEYINSYPISSDDSALTFNVYDLNYIAIADTDKENVKATIMVTEGEDNRLVSHIKDIPLLTEGENKYEYGHEPSYLVVSNGFSTKEYAASWGVWYRCIINPHTTTQIDIPMSGDLNIYEDPDAVYSKYYEGYGGIYPYTYTNDTDEAKEIYLNLNTVTGTPSSDKIVVTSTPKADKLVTMKEQAIALTEGTYTTTSDNLLTAQVPYGYYEDETTIHYSQNTGKLYAITIPSKYTVYMNANKAVIGLYSDLEVPALWCEEGGLSCYNLTDKEIIYYLWVDGDNDAVTLNISYEAMEVDTKEEENEDGEKVKVEDTKVPTEDENTTIIVSESKDLTTDQPKDTVVKVENDKFSEEAIMKSIEVAGTKQEQYDKEDCTAQVSIKAEIKDDTDATISKNVIDSIKSLPTAVDLEISKKDEDGNVEYTWNFKAESIANLDTNKVPSVNTKVDIFQDAVGYDKKDELENLTEKDSKNCVVSFQHEGLLPDNTEVSIKVGSEYEEGSTLYYYHIDAGKLTFIGSAVVKNGYVPLTISHCSDYVISDMKVGEEVHPVEAIKISAGDTDVKKVEVASTINLVAIVSPKNADDTSVTWSSSDDAIATVDAKTGVVTAGSQGEVTIKATANDGSDVFGEIKLNIIEKVCKHENTKVRNAKEASCTEAGYTGDTYCVDCDAKLKTGEVIAKKEHTSSDWIVDKAATVEAEGSRHKECTVCKTVLAKEAIAKLPSPTPTPDPEPTPEPVVTPDVTIRYTTHVQTFGWQGDENNASKWFVNGKMAGTSGKAKRLEGIKIRVYGNDNLGIQYTTHCQSYGWLPWSVNGEMNGTEGEAKRLEAIKIQLTGADKDKYDVYYRVHAQSYGWLGWAKNGAPSGTAGYAKRLEGIQIVVVKKGAAAPGTNFAGVNAASGVHQAASYVAKAGSSPVVGNQATSNTNPSVAGEANVNVAYRTHVQTFGWQGWKYNGQMSGTSGQAKRLEGINIKLTNKPYSGSIVYTTHVQTYGWQGNENNPNTWKRDGDMSGTSGEAKRLEAIRIALTGEMAEHYDVYYRVHAQSFGWLGWAKNGEAAGTAGLAKRLEGIQIVLVPKNGKAPAMSYQGITSVKAQAYIKK